MVLRKRSRSRSPANSRKRGVAVVVVNSSAGSRSRASSETVTPMVPPSPLSTSFASSSEASTESTSSSASSSFVNDLLSPQHGAPQATRQTACISNKPNKAQLTICTNASMVTTSLPTPRTTCEPSHDETVISAYVANGFQYPASISLTQYAPTESFPMFQSGDVHIKSSLVNPPKHWQLHSAILARHSPWFARSLQQDRAGGDDQFTWFSYTVEEVEGKIGLVRHTTQGERPTIPALDGDKAFNIAIKTEENGDTMSPPISPTKELSRSTTATSNNTVTELSRKTHTEIYNQIFGTFYSIPPTLPTTSLHAALTHSEQLLETAHDLGSPHLLTPHISSMLLSIRHPLFRAISIDPARWLLLSTVLQNDSIYTEALIHLAGAYPYWPWPTKRTALPEEIQRLIQTKSRALDQMCLEAERGLLLLTIQDHRGKPIELHETSQFDTWFIVQTFRDVLAREINALEYDKKKSIKRGTMFRKICRGGSAYMDYEEMRRLMERIMPGAVESLSADLTLLKESASGIVQELAVNELMLDVEINKVGYLTCTKVEKEDIPWRAGRPSEA